MLKPSFFALLSLIFVDNFLINKENLECCIYTDSAYIANCVKEKWYENLNIYSYFDNDIKTGSIDKNNCHSKDYRFF